MKLITGKQEFAEKVHFQTGAGNFLIRDTRDRSKRIRVFYYKPKNFSDSSRILIVVPGSGRNADDYRDAWIAMAEKYNVVILSPVFSELYYNFEDYHLGGIADALNLMSHVSRIENTNKVKLNEELVAFTIRPDPEQWLFGEFDNIFDVATVALGSTQSTYDVFGHSAGGHIVHRMALFHSSEKVNRLIASNASFYTLPSTKFSFPFGIRDSPLSIDGLRPAFHNNLVLLLGEEDNANETRGIFLISTSADMQGSHRLERGKYFYKKAKEAAGDLGCAFNWDLAIIPGVGHDFKKMGEAAGDYLYP